MIRSLRAIYARTREIIQDNVPEPFTTYRHGDDLGLGWYPSRVAFADMVSLNRFRALPDLSGAVFPYYYRTGRLSHLLVSAYLPDGRLDGHKQAILSESGRRHQAGVFGFGRLARIRQGQLVVAEDPLLACQNPNVVAVNRLSLALMGILSRYATIITLKGHHAGWISEMLKLTRVGISVNVGDISSVEYVSGAIIELFNAGLALPAVTARVIALLEPLVPLEKAAVITLVKQRQNLDLRHILPEDFAIYRREEDFYAAMEQRLHQVVTQVKMAPGGLDILDERGVSHFCPYDRTAVGAVVCELTGNKLDLVDLAYHDLKEMPSCYLFARRDELAPRADVSRKIADVALAVLTRMASREHP